MGLLTMAHNDQTSIPKLTMEDDQGIIYLVENAQQFWSGMRCYLCYFSNFNRFSDRTGRHVELSDERATDVVLA